MIIKENVDHEDLPEFHHSPKWKEIAPSTGGHLQEDPFEFLIKSFERRVKFMRNIS